jgi:hypothetical protein
LKHFWRRRDMRATQFAGKRRCNREEEMETLRFGLGSVGVALVTLLVLVTELQQGGLGPI